ncbi:hypothetical protein MSG28_015584 [Choristoneura fumiferana]|uniref:Uncharacterized protein n=1 Tax=Choristoneura fumiferana TaxID=7141 RepID=A0ACC0KAQ1_CHOFU|nr:hypothetical protein MSG28_015584 [Choristoneura fumiferana]
MREMKGTSDNFVDTSQHADEGYSDNLNKFKNNEEDPLHSVGVGVSETKYYKLDQIVFAEPINVETSNNLEEPDHEDVGELIFMDNVVIKKRIGKRNKYMIDMEEGSLRCPMAHIRKVHCATAKYVCERCGAAFTARYLLERHAAVHRAGRVQCTVCGKRLSQRTSMSAHLRTHGAARQHECPACHRSFLRQASLRRHLSMRLLYLFISRKAISLAPIAFPAGAAMFASMRCSPTRQFNADVPRRRNLAVARRNTRTKRPHGRKMVKTKDADHIQSNLIIAAVRDRPCLFDSNHPNNGDRAEKARSWDEVYASVIPGYGALEMAEKFAAGMLIRWLFADAWGGACGGRAAASRRRPVSGSAADLPCVLFVRIHRPSAFETE